MEPFVARTPRCVCAENSSWFAGVCVRGDSLSPSLFSMINAGCSCIFVTRQLILNYSLIDTEINSVKVSSLFILLLSGVYVVITNSS